MPKVVIELGSGWLAEMTWPDGRVQGGPSELRLYPVDPDNPPVGGVSSSILRDLDFRAAAVKARGSMTAQTPELDLGPVLSLLETHGVTDEVLVSAAYLYVSHVERGGTGTVSGLAEAFGRSEVTVRSWLTRARKKGFLTGAHGKLGGHLTPKALDILGKA